MAVECFKIYDYQTNQYVASVDVNQDPPLVTYSATEQGGHCYTQVQFDALITMLNAGQPDRFGRPHRIPH
jgi:hypothetical protein